MIVVIVIIISFINEVINNIIKVRHIADEVSNVQVVLAADGKTRKSRNERKKTFLETSCVGEDAPKDM